VREPHRDAARTQANERHADDLGLLPRIFSGPLDATVAQRMDYDGCGPPKEQTHG
jgi:hypothetical protein